jgi:cold shock protein
MNEGRVVGFDAELGYGWISRGEGMPDLFCHFTAIDGSGYRRLAKGDWVSYDVEVGPKGKPQAANVRVIEQPEARRA